MLTVTTRDARVFTIGYRRSDDSGERLFVRLAATRAGDDAVADEVSPDRWYLLNVLNPMPPLIGQEMALVLHVDDQDAPMVHRTTTVMSVVGML